MFRLLLSVTLFMTGYQGVNAREIAGNRPGTTTYRLPNVAIRHTVKEGRLQFSAKGTRRLDMSVYLFEASGKLVSQAALQNNQTISLLAIPKGAYFFEIFSDDLRIENGTVLIR